MECSRSLEAVIPGVQGRVLAVLAETTAELSLRTLARLAGASAAQASRVLRGLVDLGLVERREVPPSSLFTLNREHVTAPPLLALARAHSVAQDQMRSVAAGLSPSPASIVVFGSFARREADRHSDIDAVMVRPDDVGEDDDAWGDAVAEWSERVRAITGNSVAVIEVSRSEAVERLADGRRPLWAEIAREGIVVHGEPLTRPSRSPHGA